MPARGPASASGSAPPPGPVPASGPDLDGCRQPGGFRLVAIVLRCYPARWRNRHGEEATELAMLLLGDGTPAASIVSSYLLGAARERLRPRPSRRFGVVLAALMATAGALGIALALVFSSASARAGEVHPAKAGTSGPGSTSQCAVRRPSGTAAAVTRPPSPDHYLGDGHGPNC